MTNKFLVYVDQLSETKKKFLDYYSKLPIQKLAAEFIGKDQDTITNWKKTDPSFSDQLGRVKSEWALKRVGMVKSEWLLERILREEFGKTTTNESDNNPELEAWIVHIRKVLRPNE